MFKAAIWANKKSDNTFTLWATHAPEYEIPSSLDEGMLRLISYGGLSSMEPGTGTFLCSIKDVSREFQLGVMFLDGYISWSVDNVAELFETEFPELIPFEEENNFIPDADRFDYLVEDEEEDNDFDQWLASNYTPAGEDASGEQWFLSNSPHEFMPVSISKLREQYNLDNEIEDDEEESEPDNVTTFQIPEHYLSLIFNGDASGYTDEEIKVWEEFEQGMLANGFTNGHWSYPENQESYFSHTNDVTNLGAML